MLNKLQGLLRFLGWFKRHETEVPKPKTFVLPSEEEMLKRLGKVDTIDYVQEKFYPFLTKHGGKSKTSSGLVLMLNLAIHDYTGGAQGMMLSHLYDRMNDFIDALCSDKEIAAEAKAFYKKTVVSPSHI